VLFGLWGYYFHQAEHQTALELGQQALRLAQQQTELPPLLNAHRLLGVTYFYLGNFASCLDHMAQVIRDYDPDRHSSLGFIYGSDPCLSALSYTALCLMYLGYPDQALAYSQRALRLARELAYPFALAFTLLHVLWLYTIHEDAQAVIDQAGEQIALSSQHGFPIHRAIAEFHLQWARGVSGEAADAIPRMRRAVADWRATGARCGEAAILGAIAGVCLEAGQTADGLADVAAAIELCRLTGESYDEPNQYWIRGELLEQGGAGDQEVEAHLRRAISIARQHQSRLSELRATTHLARFWQRRGRNEEARAALAEIYGWFREGFDSPVMLAARQLLDELL